MYMYYMYSIVLDVANTTNAGDGGFLKWGTPKSSIFTKFSSVNHPFGDTPIYGNHHIFTERIYRDRASHAALNCLDCTFTLLQYIDLLSVNDKNIQAG